MMKSFSGLIVIAAVAGLGGGTSALSQQTAASVAARVTPGGNLVLHHPVWLHVQINMNYPARAQYLEKSGDATVRCKLNITLKPDECSVVSENPVGLGFGEATIKAAMQMQASSASSPGDAVEIPIHWRLRG